MAKAGLWAIPDAEARKPGEQELKSLGGLAAAAAHELGTPLNTISLVAKELKKEIGENNIFIGSNVGISNSIGGNNIFIGSESGHDNTTGGANTFIGVNSGIKIMQVFRIASN